MVSQSSLRRYDELSRPYVSEPGLVLSARGSRSAHNVRAYSVKRCSLLVSGLVQHAEGNGASLVPPCGAHCSIPAGCKCCAASGATRRDKTEGKLGSNQCTLLQLLYLTSTAAIITFVLCTAACAGVGGACYLHRCCFPWIIRRSATFYCRRIRGCSRHDLLFLLSVCRREIEHKRSCKGFHSFYFCTKCKSNFIPLLSKIQI